MRKGYYANICQFNDIVATGIDMYYYLPENPALDEGELDIRSCKVMYLESKAGWYQNNPDFKITRIEENISDFAPGLWIIDKKDEQIFNDHCSSANQLSKPDFEDYLLYTVD